MQGFRLDLKSAEQSRLDRIFFLALAVLMAILLAAQLAGLALTPKAMAGLLALCAAGFFYRPGVTRRRQTIFLWLLLLAAGWNFAVGSSRHQGGFVHWHDAGHYYLGSRYFDELGYFGLYEGMALVLEENGRAGEVPELLRNLRTKKLEQRSAPRELEIKERFTPARWRDFSADVAMVRAGLPADLRIFFHDHGYNATPLYTALFRPLASLASAGSRLPFYFLAGLDPLLLLVSLAALMWAFGQRSGLMATSFLLLTSGALLGWIGGGFGRLAWLTLLIVGLCLLKKGKPVAGGVALGLAAMLQIFPLLLLLPFLARSVREGWASPTLEAPLGAVAGGAFAGLFATITVGAAAWLQMLENLLAYLAVDAANAVGLRRVLSTAGQLLPGHIAERFPVVVAAGPPLLALLLGLAVLLAARSWRSPHLLLAAGVALIFLVFNLAGYYYLLLVVPLLAWRMGTTARAAFFAVEGICLLADFAGLAMSPFFLLRSLLVGWILLAPFFSRLGRGAWRAHQPALLPAAAGGGG